MSEPRNAGNWIECLKADLQAQRERADQWQEAAKVAQELAESAAKRADIQRERVEEYRREVERRDELLAGADADLKTQRERAERAERERDQWKARAEMNRLGWGSDKERAEDAERRLERAREAWEEFLFLEKPLPPDCLDRLSAALRPAAPTKCEWKETEHGPLCVSDTCVHRPAAPVRAEGWHPFSGSHANAPCEVCRMEQTHWNHRAPVPERAEEPKNPKRWHLCRHDILLRDCAACPSDNGK